MNQFTVYVIINEADKIYIGHTADLVRSLARHNGLLPSRKSSFTRKQGGVWRLVYKEEFTTRKEATNQEKQLKSSRGRAFIRTLRV